MLFRSVLPALRELPEAEEAELAKERELPEAEEAELAAEDQRLRRTVP